MTKYSKSPWIDRFPKSRVRSYPRQRGSLDVEVAIVGGGLTGCATAYAFAAAGIEVALVEAGKIGRGATGSNAGWVAPDPGTNFIELEQALGRRSARHAWQAWRRASLDLMTTIRRLDLKCQVKADRTITIAVTPEELTGLKREQKARRAAGLDASLVTAKVIALEAALEAAAGIKSRDGAILDPYRATVGLAAAAARRGARIFEGTPVKRTKFGRNGGEVQTAGGTIRVGRIVIASGVATGLFKALTRHFRFKSSFFALTERVPAKIRRELGGRSVVLRDSAGPPHVVRWVDDEQLLVTGADADAVPPRLREKVVVQRTGQLMYELSLLYPSLSGILPAYGWEAPYSRTADGLPYIGPHRNYPWHLFALGDSSHSVTGAYLASRILLRHHLGKLDPADEAFGFTR